MRIYTDAAKTVAVESLSKREAMGAIASAEQLICNQYYGVVKTVLRPNSLKTHRTHVISNIKLRNFEGFEKLCLIRSCFMNKDLTKTAISL